MKLTLVCEHGTRTVEIDEGGEGVGNLQSINGQRSFAQFINEIMPRCLLCLSAFEEEHSPRCFTPRITTTQETA